MTQAAAEKLAEVIGKYKEQPVYSVGTMTWTPCSGLGGKGKHGHIGQLQAVTGLEDGVNKWEDRGWFTKEDAFKQYPEVLIFTSPTLCSDCRTPDNEI
jgi:hypothetical protein